MVERVVLCQVDDLESGEVRRFDVDSTRIALVRIGEEFFALGDRCSHEDYSLSDGEVWPDECEIECPRHGSMFDLRTGEACSLPATTAVAKFEVEVDAGDVTVVVP